MSPCIRRCGASSPTTLVSLMFALNACGAIGPDFDDLDLCPNGPEPVGSVSLEPVRPTIRLGDEVTLTAMPLGVNGEWLIFCAPPLTWQNSAPAVASFSPSDGSGVVRAVAAGTTVISAQAGGRTGSSTVTVSVAPIVALAIEPVPLALRVGQSFRLSVSARDSADNALTIRTVAWSSADPAVATVSENGLLVGVESGTASVRATVEGRTVEARIPVTRDPPAIRVQQISAGFLHTCALAGGGGVPDGTAFCWGEGNGGKLGNGRSSTSLEPSRVAGTLSFTSIAAGQDHTCAIATDAATYCWGINGAGQLGDGTLAVRATPVRVSTTLAFGSVAVVSGTTCALADGGAAYCWGLSLGGSAAARTPAPFAASLRFAELLDGGWSFMCGRTLTKQVYCWGSFPGRTLAQPTLMSGTLQFEQAAASTSHVCGVISTGESYCWGSIGPSTLGPGVASAQAQVPTLIQSAVRFNALVPTGNFTCGVADAGAYCLGESSLSGSASPGSEPYPIPDESRHRFTKLSGGAFHACAIDTTGGGWCWGRNFEGQLGIAADDRFGQPSTPRQLFIR